MIIQLTIVWFEIELVREFDFVDGRISHLQHFMDRENENVTARSLLGGFLLRNQWIL